jgi:hypothetical protein
MGEDCFDDEYRVGILMCTVGGGTRCKGSIVSRDVEEATPLLAITAVE